MVGTLVVEEHDEILAMTSAGVLIRTRVEDISQQGRTASGVKVMSPDDDDSVASIALVHITEDEAAVEDDEPVDVAGDEAPAEE